MRSYSNQNIRKLTKTGSGSYYCVIPKEIIRALGWSERQKLMVKKRGEKVVLEDWKR